MCGLGTDYRIPQCNLWSLSSTVATDLDANVLSLRNFYGAHTCEEPRPVISIVGATTKIREK